MIHYIFATTGPYAVLREKYEVSIILLLIVLQVQYSVIIIPLSRPWRIMLKLFPIFLFSYSHTFHPFFFFNVPIFLDFSNKIVKKRALIS